MTINTATYQFFQSLQSPPLTILAKTLHHATEPLYLLVLAVIISGLLYYKNQKSQAILLATTAILTAAIIKTLKFLIDSPRPISSLIQETGNSFPSGHTTFAIVFFGLITYIFAKSKYKTPAIITSTLIITIIALSRLYLQVHWLTDIIGGIIIGTTILTLSILTHKKF
ncbi:phosphatase PAP2 family protein [Methanococcoides sp. SA1]|nr:phosphatase PAP2 family protein [Methanococcoides sp. SA1]